MSAAAATGRCVGARAGGCGPRGASGPWADRNSRQGASPLYPQRINNDLERGESGPSGFGASLPGPARCAGARASRHSACHFYRRSDSCYQTCGVQPAPTRLRTLSVSRSRRRRRRDSNPWPQRASRRITSGPYSRFPSPQAQSGAFAYGQSRASRQGRFRNGLFVDFGEVPN